MWRKLLDRRFERALRTCFEGLWPRSPVTPRSALRRRSPLRFEPLESRLLLSADLLPADGVLEVVGTADNDSVLVRELQTAPGAAPRLEVVVNGESQDFALDEIRAIKVDLLGGDDVFVSSFGDASAKLSLAVMTGAGDDTVSHELSHVLQQGRPLVDADFNLGEGNNRFDARFLDTFGSVAVSASGAFENSESFTLSGNLIIGEEPDARGLLAQVRGGDGRDLVTVDMSQLTIAGATREPLIRFDVDGGPGDDVLKVINPLATRGGADAEPIDPAERSAPVSVHNHSREGDDSFDLTGSDAAEKYELRAVDEPQSARTFEFNVLDLATANPLVEIGVLTVTHVALDAAGGDDVLDADIALDADWNLMLGDGDDVARIETRIGDVFAEARYRVDAGAGDNDTLLRFGDGERGARPLSGETHVDAEYRSGGGDDSLRFDWLANLDRPLTVDVDALTGAGDDSVIASWEQRYEFRTGKVAQTNYHFDLGAGEDTLQVDAFRGGDAGVQIGFANVTGLAEEVTAVDYRAGAEIAGRFAGKIDMTSVDALALNTGAGDDEITIDLDHPRVPLPKLAFATGAGDDSIDAVLNGLCGRAAIGLDLGTGSDRVAVTWKDAPPHGVTDPLLLDIALGGADTDAFIPEIGDEVLVMFEGGDPDRPFILGMAWNSEDVPQQDVKSLHLELSGVGNQTRISSVVAGGAGHDDFRLGYAAPSVAPTGTPFLPQLSAAIDLGDGDDSALIDLSGLQGAIGIHRPAADLHLSGGEGCDALRIIGTQGRDRIDVGERTVIVDGTLRAGYSGFESLRVDALSGDDLVTMSAVPLGTRTTLDGGAGYDIWVMLPPLQPLGDLTLLDFELAIHDARQYAELLT